MSENAKCPLCSQDCKQEAQFNRDSVAYDCPACGRFVLMGDARDDVMPKLSADQLRRLSCCTREQNIRRLPQMQLYAVEPPFNAPPASYSVDYVLHSIFPNRIQDRFDRALLNLAMLSNYPGQRLDFSRVNAAPVLFAESEETAGFMLQEMQDLGYISYNGIPTVNHSTDDVTITLRAAGLARIHHSEEADGRLASRIAFVAMWFCGNMRQVYDEAIEPAISSCGFDPKRVDRVDTLNKICDEMVALIRQSRFVVADFTGQRGGVYFEAGFAMGLGIPVIWTCRRVHARHLHFDTRQYPHILWTEPQELKEGLQQRIAALIPGAIQPKCPHSL